MATRITITGLFDSRAAAERAVEYMVQHHDIPREAIRAHAAGEENVSANTDERRSEGHHDFAAEGDTAIGLSEALPQDARDELARAARQAGIMVTAEVPEERREEAMRAFTENGAAEVAAAGAGPDRG